jgi:hypothetical protein
MSEGHIRLRKGRIRQIVGRIPGLSPDDNGRTDGRSDDGRGGVHDLDTL